MLRGRSFTDEICATILALVLHGHVAVAFACMVYGVQEPGLEAERPICMEAELWSSSR